MRDWDVDECRFNGGLVIEAFLLFVDPKSFMKLLIASSSNSLDFGSNLSGSRYRDICLGSRSGFPSIKSPSASIGIARTTLSRRFDSSSGYANMCMVIH